MIQNLYKELKEATCINNAISTMIQQAINACFMTHIGNTAVINHFGSQQSEEWAWAFGLYAQMVLKKMREQVDEMQGRGDLEQMSAEVATALSTCHLKAKLVFRSDLIVQAPFHGFPFMSTSIFSILHKYFSRINIALLEVSPIFFLDYTNLHMY